MNQAIFFKEWLKIRTTYFCSAIVLAAMTLYCLLRIERILAIKDVPHLWQLMLERDMVFVDVLQYVFPAVGLAVAVAQFLPEVLQKRMKLTLHLPVSQKRITFSCLGFGAGALAVLFGACALVIGWYARSLLAPELVERSERTMLPLVGGLFSCRMDPDRTFRAGKDRRGRVGGGRAADVLREPRPGELQRFSPGPGGHHGEPGLLYLAVGPAVQGRRGRLNGISSFQKKTTNDKNR